MEVLTLKAASEFLSIHPEVLRKKAVLGEIPAKKIGFGKRAPWRFVKIDLERYLSQGIQTQNPDLDSHIIGLLKDLKTSDDLEKITSAIHLLGAEGIIEAIDDILDHIYSPFTEVQYTAVRALMNLKGLESRQWVYPLLDQDIDLRTKISIAHFFNKIENDRKSAEILLSIFRNCGDETLKRLSAYGLVESHPDLVQSFLQKELTSSNAALRYRALMDLCSFEGSVWVDELRILMEDKVEKIRIKALDIIGRKNIRELLPDLIRMIESDSSDSVKLAAALAIARMHGFQS